MGYVLVLKYFKLHFPPFFKNKELHIFILHQVLQIVWLMLIHVGES